MPFRVGSHAMMNPQKLIKPHVLYSLERRQCWVLVVVVEGLQPNSFFTEVLSLNLSFFSRRNQLIATLRVVAGGLERSYVKVHSSHNLAGAQQIG